MDGNKQVVYASLGEAASRQGDFYEAFCFAKERQLPIVFVVEDNRIAISTDTQRTNPLALGVLSESDWRRVDGVDVDAVSGVMEAAIEHARSGQPLLFGVMWSVSLIIPVRMTNGCIVIPMNWKPFRVVIR